MSASSAVLPGPDLTRGIPLAAIPDGGMVSGHANGKAVLLVRRSEECFALGAHCTHYGAPLGDGLVVGDEVRCPWHHACFSLRSGEAVAGPALIGLARFEVKLREGTCFVGSELPPPPAPVSANRGRRDAPAPPTSVVIVGAGAAGNAAAEALRREGFAGPITLIGAEQSVPYDRPSLSKEFLAGTAAEEWIPLRPAEFYREQGIDLVLGRRAAALDLSRRRVELDDGSAYPFEALLLATGATPVRLPASVDPHRRVHYLRTLTDCRALIAAATQTHRAVVVGASFIGLEVAAALRARGLEVHVVAPEGRPLERILGRECGDFLREVHESQGVTFHLQSRPRRIDALDVVLETGERIRADLVIAGIGVRPEDELARRAGLSVDHGILVDEYLETSESGVYAAGDVARFPDSRGGGRIRPEHWVIAGREGQAAARNMLGGRAPFTAVPFFWSQHYDVVIACVGHAERWDELTIAGSLQQRDCTIGYRAGGRTVAVVTIGRDRANLTAEVLMERRDWDALASLSTGG